MKNNFKCKICLNNTKNSEYKIKEMMLGLREEFQYVYCGNCSSLQIMKIPTNMERYYPPDHYYAHKPFNHNSIKSIFKLFIAKASFYQKGVLFKILNHFMLLDTKLSSVGKLNPPKNWNILDVGCGSGDLLKYLNIFGFFLN